MPASALALFLASNRADVARVAQRFVADRLRAPHPISAPVARHDVRWTHAGPKLYDQPAHRRPHGVFTNESLRSEDEL